MGISWLINLYARLTAGGRSRRLLVAGAACAICLAVNAGAASANPSPVASPELTLIGSALRSGAGAGSGSFPPNAFMTGNAPAAGASGLTKGSASGSAHGGGSPGSGAGATAESSHSSASGQANGSALSVGSSSEAGSSATPGSSSSAASSASSAGATTPPAAPAVGSSNSAMSGAGGGGVGSGGGPRGGGAATGGGGRGTALPKAGLPSDENGSAAGEASGPQSSSPTPTSGGAAPERSSTSLAISETDSSPPAPAAVVSAVAPPSDGADYASAGRVTSRETPPARTRLAPTPVSPESPSTLERSVAEAGVPTGSSAARTATPPDAGSPGSRASVAQDAPAPFSGLSDNTPASDKATASLLPAVAHPVTAESASKLLLPALRAPITAANLAGPVKAAARKWVELRPDPHAVLGFGYGRAERLRAASFELDLDQARPNSAHPSWAGGFVPLLDGGAAVPSKKASTGIGTGTSAPAVDILGLLALIAPRRSWRLRPRHDAPVATPVVLLLDHPG